MEQILLSSSEVSLAKSHATLMELGGKSFRDKDSRKENLSLDQLVGALGEMAFSIYLTGSKHAWELTRRARNTCIGVGDDGEDLLGLNVDVKTSLVRSISRPIWEYNLAVRPAELRDGTVYVLALVTKLSFEQREFTSEESPGWQTDDGATVNLMGWAEREDLPLSPNSSGTFAGAYSLPANGLNRLPSFRWLGDKSNAVRHEDNRSDGPN